ncbi:Glycerophosphodiester phosphodiesterase protein [Dioscorea alata]|uniref:Glycerophosphodiester phosphodiesterase protein n=1 Tax=Dioscorea alata TaxID=55571 RepID=A0ACB7UE44_DIOAL|nr:Glycerophosphodiester phosphodiesterase protein [Dioscorea alata]
MSYLSLTLILFFLATAAGGGGGDGTGHGVGEVSEDFSKQCPTTTCGNVEIRFPLRLNSSDSHCGMTGLVLSCASDEAFLTLRHDRGPFKVTSIDYKSQTISIDVDGFWPQCPMKNMSAIKLSDEYFSLSGSTAVSFISCSKEFTPNAEEDRISGPISCLASRGDEFVYVVDQSESMDKLPLDCMVISTDGEIGDPGRHNRQDPFNSAVDSFFHSSEVSLVWYTWEQCYEEQGQISDCMKFEFCLNCERQDKQCGLDLKRDACCINVDGHRHLATWVKLVAGFAACIIFFFMVVASTFLYISRKADRDRQLRIKVEMFLASYKTTKPTRFNYAGIKKITKRFKNKLGQGGFGSVYKGELPNGIPVAVKMLEIRSTGEGGDFINEVSTIGRIHHVNVVRLLGFCAEGSRRALVYEFMPNESLEKYIFSRDADGNRPFRMEKLLEIATGIARGVEYLHQGCDQRILHFDIKPHNILLDYEFNPKISDFGLAKLCSRDQSIVTMTAVRGTRGYIAPEIYSRNFGTVSYKSDVYSFGMLVLEMVGGRKNIDPSVEKTDEIYFPEWVYEQLIGEQNFRVAIDMMNNEEETVRKLVIVALWCIQWSPTDRPTMTRVVQMLIGSLESLELPPRPFVSSSLPPLSEE